MREQQEKAADRQADIDALRAKRAFEQGEREARLKEKMELEKKTRLLKELEVARVKQFQEREQRLTEAAENEKQMFLRILQEQKDAEHKETMVQNAKQSAAFTHSLSIKEQISNKSNMKKQNRQDQLEEGRKIRMN